MDPPTTDLKKHLEHDGSNVRVIVQAQPKENQVLVMFNQSMNWFALEPDAARNFAKKILKAAKKVQRSAG